MRKRDWLIGGGKKKNLPKSKLRKKLVNCNNNSNIKMMVGKKSRTT
jgi:hypothetical protein